MKKIGYIISALFSVLYLLNISGGIIELIPDNIPFIGNIDEVSISALLLYSLKQLAKKDKDKE